MSNKSKIPSKHNPQPTKNNNSRILAAYSYQGPLPPAAQFKDYESILPGSADRILTTYEKQLDHRHKMETRYTKTQCFNSTLGVIFGFLIAIGSIAMAGYLIYLGHETVGAIIGISSLVSLVGVFVYGTKMKQQ